jgi:alanine dehydrogenase
VCAPGRVTIIGGGVSGTNAARIAIGMGAEVTILERNLDRIAQLDDMFRGTGLKTLYSTVDALETMVIESDLVIGAVLVPGAAAPKLINREMLRAMPDGAVVVDIAIDQGGCLETSRPTTHADPTYVEEGVVHYCVANMPGGVARTSTFALNNATLPFTVALADKGYRLALAHDPNLRQGLNVHQGKITYKAVAENLGYDYTAPEEVLGISY